jgi:hypothetical protein
VTAVTPAEARMLGMLLARQIPEMRAPCARAAEAGRPPIEDMGLPAPFFRQVALQNTFAPLIGGCTRQ